MRRWEEEILKIKHPRELIKASGHRHPIIEDICAQGYAETWCL